jgi:hypothetical protein
MGRIDYYRRIFSAYLMGNTSRLTFWHGEPKVNENSDSGSLGEYYMAFIAKANYPGHGPLRPGICNKAFQPC